MGVEAIGVTVIGVFAVYAVSLGVVLLVRGKSGDRAFHEVRYRFTRGILIGLEFLVAGDIIHTVAVELTFETVGVLAVIVLIRTFLSFTLEVEISGKWPWEQEGVEGGRKERAEG